MPEAAYAAWDAERRCTARVGAAEGLRGPAATRGVEGRGRRLSDRPCPQAATHGGWKGYSDGMRIPALTLRTLLLFAWLASAAACGDADDAGDADGGTGGAAGDSGDAAPAPDGFAGTVRIGAALSETGKFAVEGKDSRQGYDTWLRWVNDVRGGIGIGGERHKAEIVYYDDESDADTAANLVQRLIDEDGVDFLLGPYSSSLTTGASAIAEKAGVIMVEGNGTSDTMFERGFQNLFLTATIASDYTRSGIEALAARGARTAVIAYEDTSFPTAVASGAMRHLEASGVEVLAVETYPKDVQDVSAIMTKFRGLDPDVFVGGGHYNDAVLFVNSAKELGFEPEAMLITVGPSNPKLVEELGEDVEGVLGPTQWEPVMAYEGEYFGSAEDYADYYESLWGERPVYQAASATASALALHLAIEAAGSTATHAVREALREMSVDTFYGPISFDARGVNADRPMGTIQVQDGRIVVVAPEAAASSDLRYPLG